MQGRGWLALLIVFLVLVIALGWSLLEGFKGSDEGGEPAGGGEAGRERRPYVELQALDEPLPHPPPGAETPPERDLLDATTPEPAPLDAGPVSPPLSLVYGLVTGPSGQPLDGVSPRLAITDEGGERTGVRIEEGRYSLAGVPAGRWTLKCSALGYATLEKELVLSEPGHRQRIDFALVPQLFVDVLVTPRGGGSLADLFAGQAALTSRLLEAAATREAPGERLPASLRYQAGRFRTPSDLSALGARVELHPDCIGRLELSAPPPLFVSLLLRDFVLETRRIESPVHEIAFHLSAEELTALLASLELTLVDAASGEPVRTGTASLSAWIRGTEERPDERGRIRFEPRPPGRGTLTIEAPGYARIERRVELEPGRLNDMGAIELHRPVQFECTFRDPEGNPLIVHASFSPHRPGDLGTTLAHEGTLNYRSGQDGRIQGAFLAPDMYVLRLRRHDESRSMLPVLVDTRLGPVEGLELVLHPTGVVRLRPATAEVGGLDWFITTRDGIPQTRGRFREPAGEAPVALRLAPGAWRLLLIREDGTERVIDFEVGAEPLELDVAG